VTGRFLDLREELRFLLDEVLFRIRADLLALGRLFGLEELTLFLTPAEIGDLAAGRLNPEDARRQALPRRERFLTPCSPSTFWVEGRPEFDFTLEGTLLRGIGTSPGQAAGRAVIVSDPAAAAIRRGDIVVARHTDPGWTPILSLVGGIITEEGGLLNHCSIVARELGVPAVVGVSQATRRIPEGARLTLDGGSGVVQIEKG
jgi:pyruvate,water dikinase